RGIEGRLPEKSGEAVVGSSPYTDDIEIGSVLKFKSGTNVSLDDSLKTTEYTIVGVVETPYYLAFDKGSSTIGNGQISNFIMIPQDDFQLDVYTEVFVTAADVASLDTFSLTYEEALKPLITSIEELSLVQAEVRYDEILEQAYEELEKNTLTYEEKKSEALDELQRVAEQLEEARLTLESGTSELASKKREFEEMIAEAKIQLAEGESELANQETALNQALIEFYANKEVVLVKLEEAKQELTKREDDLNQLQVTINQLNSKLEDHSLTEDEKLNVKAQLDLLQSQYESGANAVAMLQSELEKQEQALINGEQELVTAKQTLSMARESLATQKLALEAEVEQANEQFQAAEEELEQGATELAEGQEQYEKALQEAEEEFKKAEEQLEEAKQQVEDLVHPEWYVLTREQHYSFVDYKSAADSIDAISQVFPIFFFMVAALVCLTTMTRMVDEQRMTIGTLKALGYGKWKIASKFLIYAGVASITGSLIGAMVGNYVFPTVVLDAYSMMYILPSPVIVFSPLLILTALFIAVGVTTLSAYFAVNSELVATPSVLMRPKSPKEGKRILFERIPFIWNHLSFIGKVTVRNLFRYKKRFFMTVFGISGCTALLLTGFGLKDSIRTIVDKQFGTLFLYDMTLTFNHQSTEEEKAELIQLLNEDERFEEILLTTSENGKIMHGDEEKDITIFIPEDLSNLDEFIHFQNRKTEKLLQLTDEGAILTEKVAKQLNVTVGDTVTLENADGYQVEVLISGVTENYISHYIYLSKDYYEELFNQSLSFSQVVAKTSLNDVTESSEFSTELMARDAITGVSFVSSLKESFDDMIHNLNYVIILLIISAGALAFIVLYNLTNVNISERMREIATIKVLGFYDQEVSAYIYRENIILTIIGAFVGLALGALLHLFVMTTVEMDMMMFGRQIRLMSYIYAAGLTFIFAAFVNLAMYSKLKRVEMVESLKSVD
ncbi:MAG: FtsX-like permease family protein, partial [Turicibacter sp.]|nr:FtsX-like permease family protein [Turicibacter sp.]